MGRRGMSKAQKEPLARINAAKKQKRTSTADAPPAMCVVFSNSVSLMTKALNAKKAMPDGVKRKVAGRKAGSSDSVKRKKRWETSPVKAVDAAGKRPREEASFFSFDKEHALRVDKRTGPFIGDTRFDKRKDDRTHDNPHRALIPLMLGPTHAEKENVARFLYALTHEAVGKPEDLESACEAILSRMSTNTTVSLHRLSYILFYLPSFLLCCSRPPLPSPFFYFIFTVSFVTSLLIALPLPLSFLFVIPLLSLFFSKIAVLDDGRAKELELENESLRTKVADLEATTAKIFPVSTHNFNPSVDAAKYLNQGKSARGQMNSTFYDHLTVLNAAVEKVFGTIFVKGQQVLLL